MKVIDTYLDTQLEKIDVHKNEEIRIQIQQGDNKTNWLNVDVKINLKLKQLVSKLTGLSYKDVIN